MNAPLSRPRSPLIAAALLLVAAGCGPRAPQPQPVAPRPDTLVEPVGRARVRVLATNDVHGYLLPSTPEWAAGERVGGVAALAGYFRRDAEAFDGPTLILDGGDVMQGTPISNLTDGRSTVAAYNAMGYDAAAVGNHEFDWGVDVLRQRMAQAGFPWLSANIVVAGTDTAPAWLEGTAMVPVPRGLVGIIGLSTEETPEETRPSNVAAYAFRDLAATIDARVPVLRDRGADFVIVVAHAGAYCDEDGCEGEIIDAAAAVTNRPDLIVAGHTHAPVATRVNGIPIVESRNYGAQYSVVDLERVSGDSVAVHIRAQPIAWTDSIAPDPELAALVAELETELDARVSRVVARMARPLRESRSGHHGLGRLIADAQRHATAAQVAIMNNGGIRRGLPAGPVTFGDLQELQPFENMLVRLRLTGAQLRRAIEHSLADDGREAHVSGLRVHWDPGLPSGERVVRLELDGGEPVEPDGVYTVTVNDFMAEGGDGFDVLTEAERSEDTGIVDLDALIDYLESRPQPVAAPEEPRFIEVEAAVPG